MIEKWAEKTGTTTEQVIMTGTSNKVDIAESLFGSVPDTMTMEEAKSECSKKV